MLKKILLIEDDTDILDILRYILQSEGYVVVTSEDGKACQHLLEILPDLILMDIRLKDAEQNGDKICAHLKSQPDTCGFPLFLLSAECDLPALSKACGADGYISKPFDIAELTEKVHDLLR